MTRDDKGRFVSGHPGGPGRPPKTAEQASLDKFRSYFRNGNLEDVIEAHLRQCKKGNIAAIKLAYEYLIGSPAQTVDLNAVITRIVVEHVRSDNPDTGAAPGPDNDQGG
jgi:hypothetical protein